MARESDPSAAGGDDTIQTRVQELTWALVDQEINEDEVQLLDSLLLSDAGARTTYIDCMQLHTDLMFHYSDAAEKAKGGKTPVLGFLSDALPPTGVQPPVPERN